MMGVILILALTYEQQVVENGLDTLWSTTYVYIYRGYVHIHICVVLFIQLHNSKDDLSFMFIPSFHKAKNALH